MNILPKSSGYLLLLAFVLQVAESFLFGGDDSERSAAACYPGNDKLNVECGDNEKIKISKVEYGSEPLGKCDSPRERNDCMQFSRYVTAKAKAQCDSKVKCSVEKTSIKDLPFNEVVPIQNTCGVGGTFYEKVSVNFIKITYTCTEYVFCNELSDKVQNLRLGTKSYPERTTTNPTCECTFESGDRNVDTIQAVTNCNGTVMFNVESTVFENGRYVNQSEKILCEDKVKPKFLIIGRSKQAVKMKISVDRKLSTDSSSFSFFFVSYFLERDSQSGGIRHPEANVKVSCVEGAIVLSTTMQYIVYVGVPCAVVSLILLIVVYCICNKRRKKRERIKRLEDKALRLENGDVEAKSDSDSPAFSTPPSTRHKPDGKIDSASDDDLAEIATLLHTRNKQRRIQEVAHRHMFDEDMPWLSDRKSSLVPKTAVERMAQRGYSTPPENPRPTRDTGRSQSAANLHSTTPPSMEYQQLKNSKSVSNSRSSVRSTKRRAPLPPGYPLTSQPETPEPSTPNNITSSEPSTHNANSSSEFPPPPPAVQYSPEDETCIISNGRNLSRATSRSTSESSHLSKNNNNSDKKQRKNKNKKKKVPYHNPYHVEKPKRPNKSNIGAKSSDREDNDRSNAKRPSVGGFEHTRFRRYSGDSQESDKASDHEFEDLEQIDVMGIGEEDEMEF